MELESLDEFLSQGKFVAKVRWTTDEEGLYEFLGCRYRVEISRSDELSSLYEVNGKWVGPISHSRLLLSEFYRDAPVDVIFYFVSLKGSNGQDRNLQIASVDSERQI